MNRITSLFQIEKPIIQAGMVWCSGWKLASAVSNSGGLGIIGAGSMYPDILKEHILKCKATTSKPFAVNLPLLYPDIAQHIETIIEEKAPIVFTSAGNPKTWTAKLKAEGIKVVHVVSSKKFALKAQDAGVDVIVAEGFEAGGHNGREETTSLCLIPMVSKAVQIPVIAAGGIASGEAMLACEVLGAEGFQIGSLFASSIESSAHQLFKQKIIDTQEGGTELSLKSVTPVRLIKNEFYTTIKQAELEGASPETLKHILGKGRAKAGMFEGDLIEGELEIGQVAASIEQIKPAKEIVAQLWADYKTAKKKISDR